MGKIYFFKAHINNLSFGKYFMTVYVCNLLSLLFLLSRCYNEFTFPEPTLVNAEE